jgi:hypothetical protein
MSQIWLRIENPEGRIFSFGLRQQSLDLRECHCATHKLKLNEYAASAARVRTTEPQN